MKKNTRRYLIILSPLLIIIIVIAVLFFKYKDVITTMAPADTQTLNDSVYCIKDGYVNAYLFKSGPGYLMFDGGNNEKNVLEELSELGIKPEEIHTVLLTHTDGDHIAALGALKNADVYMHREEKQMVDGTTERLGSFMEWEFGEYKLFDSDQVMDIFGLSVKVIHSPGHTPGSCCFVVNDSYFVTGDNLFLEDGSYTPFVEAFCMDAELNSKSISRLPKAESFKYVLTGHGGIWRDQ